MSIKAASPRKVNVSDRNGQAAGANGENGHRPPQNKRFDFSDDRRRVIVDADEHRVTDEVAAALADDDQLFSRDAALVRVVCPECGAAKIVPAPLPWLRERITRAVNLKQFVPAKKTKGGEGGCEEKQMHPPDWLVQQVAARGEWSEIASLAGVSDIPILRPDGSIWTGKGQDPQTRIYYTARNSYRLRTDPKIGDAREAVKALKKIVAEFPFVDERMGRSAWLASVLTPVARSAFAGPSPGFLFEGNKKGIGKTRLAQVASIVGTGTESALSGYCHEPEELGKIITSFALEGVRVIIFDNVTGPLGNEPLDRALTATKWKGRLLGRNETRESEWQASIYFTANNAAIAADTARRLLLIRLEVMLEKAEERKFKCKDLLKYVRSHQTSFTAAALTILSAYLRSDRDELNLTPFGSFEEWSSVVRSALVWAGEPDPCQTREQLAGGADTTTAALASLMCAWQQFDPHNVGVIIAQMLNQLYPPEQRYAPVGPESVAMRAAIEALAGGGPGRPPSARAFGACLRSHRRSVIGSRFLDVVPDKNNNAGAVWKLFELTNAQKV